jgi:threonylcarbamoyladenosine tRNA methylthiotransferase MtaB
MIVTGCYAQLKSEEVARIEGVDLVLGTGQKPDIFRYLDDLVKRGKGQGAVISSSSKDIRTFSPSCSADDRTRHFLKVQDGCDYYCSYCTIPFARGRSRNGTIASLVAQAKGVAEKGGKEIVLAGVNIGDFGKSTGESFLDLLKALDNVEGIERYRISSIEPNLITDEAIDFTADSKRFAPHFHIPLQSGSDEVLKLMRRRYDTALFRHKIEKVKAVIPHAFIGVDVIVGTRGETDELFEETLRFIEGLDISRLHVFSYSERPGTQALNIEYKVDPKIKHKRSQLLLNLSEEKHTAFYESHAGSRAVVLFEHTRKGDMMYGFTENYIRVEAPYDKSFINTVRPVLLGGWNGSRSALLAKTI